MLQSGATVNVKAPNGTREVVFEQCARKTMLEELAQVRTICQLNSAHCARHALRLLQLFQLHQHVHMYQVYTQSTVVTLCTTVEYMLVNAIAL